MRKSDCEGGVREIAEKYQNKREREVTRERVQGMRVFGKVMAVRRRGEGKIKGRVFQGWRVRVLEGNIGRQNQEIIENTLIEEHKFKLKARIFLTWKALI